MLSQPLEDRPAAFNARRSFFLIRKTGSWKPRPGAELLAASFTHPSKKKINLIARFLLRRLLGLLGFVL